MYILYNNALKKPLIHPKVGLWQSVTKEEAESLLEDIKNFVKDIGQPELVDYLVVKEVTGVL